MELSVSLLNIQVGLIRKAWKHPSADRFVVKNTSNLRSLFKISVRICVRLLSCVLSIYSLLVEEIDVGEGKVRQVVSGLAKFCSPDDLTV